MPRAMAPAIATTSAACAPKINSAANSMTNDGGIVARSSVADGCAASAEIRIPARIKPQNSMGRSGCSQPK